MFLPKIFIISVLCIGYVLFAIEGVASKTIKMRQQQMHKQTTLEEIEDVMTTPLNVYDYILLGLQRNLKIKTAFYKWQSAFKNIAKTFSLPDSQISYTHYLKSVETRIGSQNSAFFIQQKFPMFDKLWIRKSIAFQDSEMFYYLFQKEHLDFIEHLTKAYYEYAYIRKEIILIQENIKLLKNFAHVTQVKYVSGLKDTRELLHVQIELEKLQNELYRLKDMRIVWISRLNDLLNSKINTKNISNDALEISLLMDDNLEKLQTSLKKNNLQLKILDANIRKNRDILKLMKREYIPDLSIKFSHINTESNLDTQRRDDPDAQMIMFSFNMPIWYKSINANIAVAKHTLTASEVMRSNEENALLSKLSFLIYKLKKAYRQSQLYENVLIPKTKVILKTVKSRYESGDIKFALLIDEKIVLFNMQLAYYRHNANYNQTFFELQNLLGNLSVRK